MAADTVTTQILTSNTTTYVAVFTNVSQDGVGESAVTKVDISGLAGTPTKVKIQRVWYSVFGMSVTVAFNHTSPDTVLVLQGDGSIDFRFAEGVKDPASTGGTGDIQFTTLGHSSGDTYTIMLELEIA